MKILGIDDNQGLIETLADLFNMMEHEFSATTSGREAIDLIKKNQYDVILLDYLMPEFSGLDVIKELETMGNITNFNIFLFSATIIPESELDELFQKGVRGIFKKPVEVDDLINKLSKFCADEQIVLQKNKI